MNQMEIVAPQLPAEMQFDGNRSDFRRLITRGGLLEIVTLGFYRFWLATDMRRHLWSHINIDGDFVEYTGRGRELLNGALIAAAILLPIYLVYFIIGIEIERMQALGSIPLVACFYVLSQFALYRARRYRLTRTVWRGVRFGMQGSGWAYAARSTLWTVITVLTLGLALPWRAAALERYKMENSFYGDLQGDFEGKGLEFFKSVWWIWLIFIVSIILGAVAHMTFLIAIALAPFLYPIFKSIQWRWWLSGLRFGEVKLESSLNKQALITTYLKAICWWVLSVIVFTGYLFLCATLFANAGGLSTQEILAGNGSDTQQFLFQALSLVGYASCILSCGVVMRIYLLRDVWALLIESISIDGIEATRNVIARGGLADAIGEGLANDLDVAGF
jgi:uncharacterized membrane protein YjgN (DUF898 family)